jgi:hypothetical protein
MIGPDVGRKVATCSISKVEFGVDSLNVRSRLKIIT